MHEAYMFALRVTKQLENWPEKDIRKREWVSLSQLHYLPRVSKYCSKVESVLIIISY